MRLCKNLAYLRRQLPSFQDVLHELAPKSESGSRRAATFLGPCACCCHGRQLEGQDDDDDDDDDDVDVEDGPRPGHESLKAAVPPLKLQFDSWSGTLFLYVHATVAGTEPWGG